MRRKDREVKEVSEILDIIDRCDVCSLGLCDGDQPYIVPMNFGYAYRDGVLTLYFHGARVGQKLDIIAKNPRACFEMDCNHRLITGEEAIRFSMEYESVIGFGTIELCASHEEKRDALTHIMRKYAPERTFEYPERVLETTGAFRLTADSFTGKRFVKKRD